MDYRLKAAIGWGLSLVPAGRALHSIVQRKVTKTLPMPEQDFADRCEIALQHLHAVQQHLSGPLEKARFFEFGAGWDLIVPQVYFSAGVRHQHIVDLHRLVSPDLVEDANRRLRQIGAVTSTQTHKTRVSFESLPDLRGKPLDAMLGELGIVYQAPADATNSGLPDASFDVVTSSLVLEHVPGPVIGAIFREMFRIVRPGGVVSSSIDMSDHYSHADSAVAPWNFLRYGPAKWRLMNPPILYQNRLRASEQLDLIRASGLKIVSMLPRFVGSVESFEAIRPRFAEPYTGWAQADDLRTTQLHVVATRP